MEETVSVNKEQESDMELYTPEKLMGIRTFLEYQTKRNRPMFFRIWLDREEIIERTSDMSLFDDYQEFIGRGKKLTIKLYNTATSHICRRVYVFDISHALPPIPAPNQNPAQMSNLQGTDLRNAWQEDIARERQNWEKEQQLKELTKDNQTLSSRLQEAEKYIDDLEQHLSKKAEESGEFKQLLGPLLEKLIGFSNVKDKADGLASLGATNENGKEEQGEQTASFKKKGELELDEQEKQYIQYLRKVSENFSDEEWMLLMNIQYHLIDHKKEIKPVAELLNLHK